MPSKIEQLERAAAKAEQARREAEAKAKRVTEHYERRLKTAEGTGAHWRKVLRDQRLELEAAGAEAAGRVDQLQVQLDQERADHAGQTAELHEQVESGLANAAHQYELEVAALERIHAAEVERLAEAPAAKRSAEAEQARKAAEAKLAETTRRLEGQLAEAHSYTRDRERELRQLLANAQAEHVDAEGRAAGLQAALDQGQAKVAELQARLEPPQPAMMVPVKWLKDSPAEGCHVGDHVYRGVGPRYARSAHLGPDGALVTPLARDGDLERMPLGTAQVLQASGHVHIVGPASWRADLDAAMSGGEPPRTPEELRTRARQLEMFAEQLERANAEQVEDARA